MDRPRTNAGPWRFSGLALVGAALAACDPVSGGIPPILVTGSAGDTASTRQFAEEPREYRNVVNSSLRADSYIWQPWFITAGAGGTVAYEVNKGGLNDSDGLVFSGDARLGILPVSHYPTELGYSHTDSRADGTLGSDFVRDRATFTNQALIANDLRSSTRFTYQTFDQEDDGEDESLDGGLTVTKNFEHSTLSLNLEHTRSRFEAEERGENDEKEEISIGSLNHGYSPASSFGAQTGVTAIQDEEEAGDSSRDRRSLQGISTSQWRPTDSKLLFNSALRAQREEIETGGDADTAADTKTTLFSGTLGVNYPIIPRLNSNLGLNGTYQDSEVSDNNNSDNSRSRRSLESSLLGSISYISLETPLAGFDWSWNTRSNAQGRYVDLEGAEERYEASGSLTLGHGGNRIVPLPLLGQGLFSLNQSGSLDATTEDEEDDALVPSVAHDASLTYSDASEGVTTFLRLSASDQREFVAEDRVEFQLFQALVNRQSMLDQKSNWFAALSLQATRRKRRGDKRDFTAAGNGNIGVFAADFLGVRNLGLRSELELNAIGLEELIDEDDEDDRDLVEDLRADWTTRLEYRIGRVTTSLEGSVFMVGEEFGNAVIFRVRRDFGGVF